MFSSILQLSLNDTSKRKEASGSSHSLFCCSVSRVGDLRSGNRLRSVPPSCERKLSTEEYRNAKALVLTDADDATVIGNTEE